MEGKLAQPRFADVFSDQPIRWCVNAGAAEPDQHGAKRVKPYTIGRGKNHAGQHTAGATGNDHIAAAKTIRQIPDKEATGAGNQCAGTKDQPNLGRRNMEPPQKNDRQERPHQKCGGADQQRACEHGPHDRREWR